MNTGFANALGIANVSANVVTSLVTAVGAVVAYFQWRSAVSRSRAQFLEALLKEFNSNPVIQAISAEDSDRGADKFFKHDLNAIDNALSLISYVCYLAKNGLVKENEFNMLKRKLERVLSDGQIQTYLKTEQETLDNDTESSRYPMVFEYVYENKIWDSEQHQTENAFDEASKDNQQSRQINTMEIELEDFFEPTMVIKISRNYHDGMTEEQLLEKTEKWWRINPEIANKVSLVLAAANGKVIRAYRVNGKWQRDATGAHSGRYCFSGVLADRETRERFEGRSLASLFPKGAVNPIRYFKVDC